MTSRERNASATRKDGDELPPTEPQASRSGERNSSSQDEWLTTTAYKSASTRNPGPRIWVLPTSGGEWWSIPEQTDTPLLARSFSQTHPVLLAPKLNTDECQEASARAKEIVNKQILGRCQEALFVFMSRMILSVAWLLLAAGGLALPGEVRFLDGALLILGSVFFFYTIIRHGLGWLRWHYWRVDASHSFSRVRWVRTALIERLRAALAFRKKLSIDERGKSPDEELQDANAYKKLIREGITTPAELGQLGKAIEARLKLGKDDAPIGELARSAGLDTESAVFYRDLAYAAGDIAVDPEFL